MARAVDLRLYLVTDRRLAGPRGVEATVAAAVAGGVTLVQLRDPDAKGRELVATARRLKELLAPQGIALIINDRVDVALAADADGVHIGQADMDPRDVRRLIGPDRILGLSVGTPAEWEASVAMLEVVDYLGVGPVHDTATKADAGRGIGPGGVAAVVALTRLPVVAIGGLGASSAGAAILAGADGIAVVSAIMAAADPTAAAEALRRDIDTHLAQRGPRP